MNEKNKAENTNTSISLSLNDGSEGCTLETCTKNDCTVNDINSDGEVVEEDHENSEKEIYKNAEEVEKTELVSENPEDSHIKVAPNVEVEEKINVISDKSNSKKEKEEEMCKKLLESITESDFDFDEEMEQDDQNEKNFVNKSNQNESDTFFFDSEKRPMSNDELIMLATPGKKVILKRFVSTDGKIIVMKMGTSLKESSKDFTGIVEIYGKAVDSSCIKVDFVKQFPPNSPFYKISTTFLNDLISNSWAELAQRNLGRFIGVEKL